MDSSSWSAQQLAEFIAGASAADIERLAQEQDALRRVATLVARGAPPGAVFAAVAAEVGLATSRLPERHREALALRESLRLSHDQIAAVMAVDTAAVAPLLARARLRLREERRQAPVALAGCEDRDRALRALARRQDSEPLTGDDDEWLFAHLGGCVECDQAHAAMLEASVCYRAAPPLERASAGKVEPAEHGRAVAARAEAG